MGMKIKNHRGLLPRFAAFKPDRRQKTLRIRRN
jgi:hypothetical protein